MLRRTRIRDVVPEVVSSDGSGEADVELIAHEPSPRIEDDGWDEAEAAQALARAEAARLEAEREEARVEAARAEAERLEAALAETARVLELAHADVEAARRLESELREARAQAARLEETLLQAARAEASAEPRQVERDPDEAQPAGPPAASPQETCDVRYWRGYRKAAFYARTTDGDEEVAIAESPQFRARGNGIPEQTGEAEDAYARLREELEAAGWKLVSAGGEWFDATFVRAPTAAAGPAPE